MNHLSKIISTIPYYEERVINDKLCWRKGPNGEYTEYSKEALTLKLMETTKVGKEDDCGSCGGVGGVDSGGFTPLGAPISIKCEDCSGTAKHESTILPLRVVDLDSPFFWGVGRDMTDKERSDAEQHGRFDNPPISVLGIAKDGLAAVDGKNLAEMFAASPKLLALAEKLAAWDKRWPKWSDSNGTSEKEMNALCQEAHTVLGSLSYM